MIEPKDGTQLASVLSYSRIHGSITPLEALRAFGCMRLAARIEELEKDYGWKFDVEIVKENGKRWARYTLVVPRVTDVELEDAGQLGMFSGLRP
ncbi:MAG: hypothetical protein FJ315_08670 [SAR202 cluster bacterium]|nr:hypothetical protein [SAR202 cluster bacterium]